MPADSKPPKGHWPLKAWCLHTSWGAALGAFLLLLAAPVITLARGDHVPGLWLFAPFWAMLYALTLAIAYGMAFIARDAPPSSTFGGIIPQPIGKVLDSIYGAMANIALIVFPVFMIKFSIFVLIAVFAS